MRFTPGYGRFPTYFSVNDSSNGYFEAHPPSLAEVLLMVDRQRTDKREKSDSGNEEANSEVIWSDLVEGT